MRLRGLAGAGAPHGWQADAPASAAPTALSSPPSIATTREDYFHNFFTHTTTEKLGVEEGRGPPEVEVREKVDHLLRAV
jgi:hypothetical protein